MTVTHSSNIPREVPVPNHDIRIQFITFLEKKGSRGYPLGILSISAFLKANGYRNIGYLEFDLFSCVRDKSIRRCKHALPCTEGARDDRIAWLIDHPPAILFIGPVFTYNLRYFVEFAIFMKKLFPNVLIFGGGPHFGKILANDRELLARHPHIAGLVIGDGEETTLDLLDAVSSDLRAGGDLESKINEPIEKHVAGSIATIPGILIARNQFTRRVPFDIERNVLLPDYTLIRNNPFFVGYTLTRRKNPISFNHKHFFYEARKQRMPFAYINGSRGCPYPCIFCAGASNVWDPQALGGSRRLGRRVVQPEAILAEIKHVHGMFGTTTFFFTDPLFLAPSKSDFDRIDKLFTLVLRESQRSGVKYRFILELRIDVVNKMPVAMLSKMMTAGVHEINLGFEKASDQSLRVFGKNLTMRDQQAAVAKIRRVARSTGVNVLVVGTFVLGGPSEGFIETFKTWCYPVRLGLDTFRLFPLEIFPGTKIEQYLARKRALSPVLDTFYGTVPTYARSKNHLRLLKVLRVAGDLVAVVNVFLRSMMVPRAR